MFGSASTTTCRLFFDVRLCFVHRFFSFSFCVIYDFASFNFCIIYVFCDATCVIFSSTSATAWDNFFFSANCTGLFTTSATGTSTTGNGYSTTSHQADDSNSSKDFFQFLCVHGLDLPK
jgi:hypothetical protein